MPDTKITALTALTAADPANDVLPIVDVSDTTMAASGTTKKISINNILASSPTATLASATITGDLTVDTNVLFVDSSSNNVGLGTLTPTGASGRTLEIYGGSGQSRIALKNDATGSASTDGSQIALVGSQLVIQNREASEITFETNGSERLRIDTSGNLGLGVTPSAWSGINAFQISRGSFAADTGSYTLSQNVYNNGSNRYIASAAALQFQAIPGTGFIWYTAPSGTAGNAITFTQAMTLDASGNLGCGITNPSHRIHALVSSGADRDIFAAQVLAASNGLQVKWNHATTTLRIICANLPTSSAGLASGTLWNDAGTIKIA